MGWLIFESHRWQSAPMPYGSGPVEVARLPSPGGEFLAFVRFPAGWSRTVPVVYQAAEEFVILQGELRINGQRWGTRTYGCVPAGLTRTVTESPGGCLAWARFHGSPKPAQAGAAPYEAATQALCFIDLGALAQQPDVSAHCRLQSLPGGETWYAPGFDPSSLGSDSGQHDALSLGQFGWWSSTPHQTNPHNDSPAAGPAIVHRTSEALR